MKEKNIEIKYYILLFSIINFLLFEYRFFLQVIKQNKNHYIFGVVICVLGFLLVYFINLIFLSFKKITKIFTLLSFLTNSSALYFMNTYKIALNTNMILNLFETNFNEIVEFINIKLFFYIFVFGIIPSFIFIKFFKINYNERYCLSILKQVLYILYIVIFFSSISIIYPKYSYNLRKNKRTIEYLIPANYMGSCIKIIKNKLKVIFSKIKINKITNKIEFDNLNFNDKKNLVVFIIGESARADNFSLNGYNRNTNKFLENEDIINFKNFYSCGTSTFISVPCIFSHFDRKNFSINKFKKYENILDVFKVAGFDLYWKSNNGNCKNICHRINFSYIKNNETQSYDEVFIDYIDKKIKTLDKKNNFLILHTRGSHGPLYFNRYPKEFEKFKPICKNKNIDECKYEELLNSYDNSIYYTSYVLSEIIKVLKKNNNKFNSILFYVSDHGESLGENNQFMHGLPYNIANNFQKHIPFFIWISQNFENYLKINKKCLRKKSNLKLSHDYIFHSLLGIFNIKTDLYNKNLDIFNGCRL